jgi:hypothetical protein
MSYINYKDVSVTYDGDEILCKDFSISTSNSLESARDRGSISSAVTYGNQRPTTVININYLIGSDGDLFYKDFKELFDGGENFSEFNSKELVIGSYSFTGPLCPQSLSISASENSFFDASVSLIYYGNIEEGMATEQLTNLFDDSILIGHSANSPVVGVSGVSDLSLSASLSQNPIFFTSNATNEPDFIDITKRKKECNIKTSNIDNFITTNGEDVSLSFSVQDLEGTSLQDYLFSGKVQSTDLTLSAEDVASVDMSIISFI